MRKALLWLIVPACFVVQSGCKKASEPQFPDVVAASYNPAGKGVGASCQTDGECRVGLKCEVGLCAPAGTQVIGQDCVIGPECVPNAFCGPKFICVGPHTYDEDADCESDSECISDVDPNARCVPKPSTPSEPIPNECQKAGEKHDGEVCSFDKHCAPGLFCQYKGLVGVCATGGDGDYAASCTEASDCFTGLVCGPGDSCMSLIEAVESWDWEGAQCETPDEIKPRLHFEVPPPSGVLSEFYRLPFPNDIRMGNGKVTAGHATPGRGPLDIDPVERMLQAANTEMTGFGTSPTIFFRFSTRLDFDSVDFTYDDTDPNLRLINIDPESEQYKQPKGYVWSASDGRGRFMCFNWLTLKPHADDPLNPSTTYAGLIMKSVRACLESDTEGGPNCAAGSPEFAQDSDFQAMLSDTKPADSNLAAAWDKYAKLRQYLKDEGIAKTDVVGAAVFTTVAATEVMSKARPAIRNLPAPVPSNAVVCGPGVESPCGEVGNEKRVCNTTSEHFVEVQGTLSIPIFQEGTPPYLDPSDGGRIKLGPGGIPQIVRTEDVCFSLTIPKAEKPPAEGWPVVLYAHGTGGTFRSAVLDGTATNLALADASANGTGIATLTIDGSMHGPRRNSTLDPEHLFFNFANPAAARGNVMQGAMDYLALVHFVETHQGLIAGVAATFDPLRIGFLGHSQGATIGPLFTAFEPSLGAVVLSGAGSGLVRSILNKTSPVDIRSGVAAALQEDPGETHPVMSIIQQLFDETDTVNYARLLTKSPPADVKPASNLLVVYGQGDTFTPPETTRLLVDVLGIPAVMPVLDVDPDQPFAGYFKDFESEEDRVVDAPLGPVYPVQGELITAGMVMHAPDGYDGHFVLFNNPGPAKQVREFFATYFKTGTAEIVVP